MHGLFRLDSGTANAHFQRMGRWLWALVQAAIVAVVSLSIWFGEWARTNGHPTFSFGGPFFVGIICAGLFTLVVIYIEQWWLRRRGLGESREAKEERLARLAAAARMGSPRYNTEARRRAWVHRPPVWPVVTALIVLGYAGIAVTLLGGFSPETTTWIGVGFVVPVMLGFGLMLSRLGLRRDDGAAFRERRNDRAPFVSESALFDLRANGQKPAGDERARSIRFRRQQAPK